MRRYLLVLPIAAGILAQAPAPDKARDLKFEKAAAPITPATAGVTVPRSYALVVGVGDYANLPASARLEYAERDAEAM